MRTCTLITALSILTLAASAQQKRLISGLVVCLEEQRPLEGVTVAVKGSSFMTGSQQDGVFYLPIETTDSVIEISYEGFETREIRLGKGNEYKIELRRKQKIDRSFQGNWRGEFILNEFRIPFRFEITRQGSISKAFFINGEERFEAGRVEQKEDSIHISADMFETELVFRQDAERLSGFFRKSDGSGRIIPITAERGMSRFPVSASPSADISGTYDVLFKQADGHETRSVGLFSQKGNNIQAVFLKTTGDSRFLEGSLNNDQLLLSSFIGSSPSFYEAEVNKDGTIEGRVRGFGPSQSFIAVRNEKATLPDPYTLTYLKPGYTSFDFKLPDLSGKTVSLKDPKYAGKVVVITLTGSWCPNCMDEASFLAPWYARNKQRGVEAIAIHFEKSTDPAYLEKTLSRFRNRFGVQYDQLVGGIADKNTVAASFPSLNNFLAFPTTLFIDKKGNVAKIYTGYSGPATGPYHDTFIREFEAEINKLLAQ
jgi:peroxiredoxin